MKTSSQAVANYLQQKASNEEITLPTFKLIKLVYLVYGFSLAFNKKSLFSDPSGAIEIWKDGPVLPALYHQLAGCDEQLTSTSNATSAELHPEEPKAELKDEKLIKVCDYVWDNFKTYSVVDLFHLTHLQNSPWRRLLSESNISTLSDEAVKRYFNILSELINGDSTTAGETVMNNKSTLLARVNEANDIYNDYLTNLQKGDNIEARERYAHYTFVLVCVYLLLVFVVLLLDGFQFLGFYLSDTIIGLLLGSSFVQIIGLFAIVMKYLYRAK